MDLAFEILAAAFGAEMQGCGIVVMFMRGFMPVMMPDTMRTKT